MGGRDGLDDREAEPGAAVPATSAGPLPRTNLEKTCSSMPGGIPGPSSETSSTASPFRRSTATRISVPGGRVAQAVVEQVDGQPVKLVRVAVDRHRAARRPGSGGGRPRPGAPRRAPRRRPRRGRTRAAAPVRPASARASSSRSETRRLIRREERSADSIISPSSPRRSAVSSRSWSSSRLARMLVSGVRSSCEASATNSRCACIICSVSERAASSSRSICSRVRASSPTSSSVSGSGMRSEGSRVEAISRAVAVSVGDRPHRAPRDRDPGQSREQRCRPARRLPRNSHSLLIVASRLSVLRAYWTKSGSMDPGAWRHADRGHRQVADPSDLSTSAGPGRGAPRCPVLDRSAVPVDDPDSPSSAASAMLLELRGGDRPGDRGADADLSLAGDRDRGSANVVVEVALEAVRCQPPDDDGEDRPG